MRQVWDEIIEPAAQRFKPDIMLVSSSNSLSELLPRWHQYTAFWEAGVDSKQSDSWVGSLFYLPQAYVGNECRSRQDMMPTGMVSS